MTSPRGSPSLLHTFTIGKSNATLEGPLLWRDCPLGVADAVLLPGPPGLLLLLGVKQNESCPATASGGSGVGALWAGPLGPPLTASALGQGT